MADLLRMLTCSVHPLPYLANPADYFAAIRHAPGAVLLDSGRPTADRGRYDLMSAWPQAELTLQPDESGRDFLQRLRNSLQQLGNAALPDACELPFAGGLIGYLSSSRRAKASPFLASLNNAARNSASPFALPLRMAA